MSENNTYADMVAFRNKENHFALKNGVYTEEISKGYARCYMDVRPDHFNVVNSVHGGALFTLMDTTGGAAATSYGNRVTTLGCNVTFLNAVLEPKRLYGIARIVRRGRKITVVDVSIADEEGKKYTQGSLTYFTLDSGDDK